MRLVIQRVLESSVTVDGKEISRIGPGMLVLLGITQGDTPELVKRYVNKILKLRIWPEIPKNKPVESKQQPQENGDKNAEEEKVEAGSEVKTKPLKTWDSNVVDNNFEVMVVSQFTLYGIMKGNKPDFHKALNPEEALKLYDNFLDVLKKSYKADKVQAGQFGAMMSVQLVNDGPVTLILDSNDKE